ncbi:uncharacterized protein A4U43_C06F10350 [Asparagus officinalis]|uniref:Uncharacterized protein n=1 Tax=Asparagus officinalis TaxID=4686 RepID=A0A5P1ERI7_ASPOF|nr:uncharacterized protein A4U43_C06F10350 [Asparagus officinalis]
MACKNVLLNVESGRRGGGRFRRGLGRGLRAVVVTRRRAWDRRRLVEGLLWEATGGGRRTVGVSESGGGPRSSTESSERGFAIVELSKPSRRGDLRSSTESRRGDLRSSESRRVGAVVGDSKARSPSFFLAPSLFSALRFEILGFGGQGESGENREIKGVGR